MRNLVITSNARAKDDSEVVAAGTLRREIRNATIFRRLLRYRSVEWHTTSLRGTAKPLAKLLTARLLSRGTCRLVSDGEGCRDVRWRDVFAAAGHFLLDLPGQIILPRRLRTEMRTWPREARAGIRIAPGAPLILRTDLSLELESGGLVSHLCGVLKGMRALGTQPLLLATAEPKAISDIANAIPLPITERYWNFPELPSLAQNDLVYAAARELCEREAVSFVYQRNHAYTISGFRIARAQNIPFILEYNGCESWMNRNWGLPLRHEALADQVEQANLQAADIVVVVSNALKKELIGRGVTEGKITVAPCGVDPEYFIPDIDATPVRTRLGLGDVVVVGFVGSFGRWHGVDILAEAFGRCSQQSANLRPDIRLLLIGDGEMRPTVEKALQTTVRHDSYHLTGSIRPAEVPSYLAACDILVSPQVANPDGTEFFGSPLKLFEYMAMGRAIIASDIGQIARVIEHDSTGILVKPGDAGALAQAIQSLATNPAERNRLGTNVRRVAVERHSWTQHVKTILDRLAERCG